MPESPIILDTTGFRCPLPVHKTRQAIKYSSNSKVIHLITDDPESLHDIPVLLGRLGLPKPCISEENNKWIIIIYLE